MHELYSTLALEAWQYNPDTVLAFHSDTPSKSVYGAYKDAEEGDLLITEGYSRDRHGDKQFQFGLIVDGQGRPVYGDVHDGNKSDKSWNPEVLQKLDAQLQRVNLQGFIYVADSAAMTRETLDQVRQAKAYLITHGGNNLKIVKQALEQADKQEAGWSAPQAFASSNTGAQYRLQEFAADYEGHVLRLIVVESSALDKKKAHTLEKQVNQRTRMRDGSDRGASEARVSLRTRRAERVETMADRPPADLSSIRRTNRELRRHPASTRSPEERGSTRNRHALQTGV